MNTNHIHLDLYNKVNDNKTEKHTEIYLSEFNITYSLGKDKNYFYNLV